MNLSLNCDSQLRSKLREMHLIFVLLTLKEENTQDIKHDK